MNARIGLPPRPRLLIVALRRLGDVLLTTPLARSLRRAFPDAEIDMLVFRDTQAILDGNPDISRVIATDARAPFSDSLNLIRALWRQYDLAITTQAGDRPSVMAIAAGRLRAGVAEARLIGRVKRAFLHRAVGMDSGAHRVEEMAAIARSLGIEPVMEVVCPRAAPRPDLFPSDAYAVIHAAPQFVYKQWSGEGWRALAAHLRARNLSVVATGGPGEAERRYLDSLWDGIEVHRLDGKLTWPEISALLQAARLFVGPDTSVTHLAAAAGCPTVAIYGPTDPRLWGPWPKGGLREKWQAAAGMQRRGNVLLVQNPLPCVPCQHEGCLRRLDSYSRCLDELPPASVIAAVNDALAAA
ncbi:MAG: glycosyltransferase family 9 protein [Pseudorhodoplanes sp.]